MNPAEKIDPKSFIRLVTTHSRKGSEAPITQLLSVPVEFSYQQEIQIVEMWLQSYLIHKNTMIIEETFEGRSGQERNAIKDLT